MRKAAQVALNGCFRWKTKYGIVGANAFDLPVVVDGLNDKGLCVGLFYFPGFAKYQEVKEDDFGKTLAPWELGIFLLGACSDVKEAVAAAKGERVGAFVKRCQQRFRMRPKVRGGPGQSAQARIADWSARFRGGPFARGDPGQHTSSLADQDSVIGLKHFLAPPSAKRLGARRQPGSET